MLKNSIKIVVSLSLIFVMFSKVNAQNISFLSDYLGNVLVFDNGNLKQIEHLPLKSYKIGNNSFAYVDNADDFKIYNNHFVHKLAVSVSEYQVTNNYIAYNISSILRLFDNGKNLSLSNDVGAYYLGENIIVWFDNIEKKLKTYSNGEILELDDALATDEINTVKVGKNIAAYTDSRGYMNIFYGGEIFELDYKDRIKSIAVGKDIVAFVEEPINSFSVFYFGEIVKLETFEPISYKAGDSFLVYEDLNNYLKMFSNFNVETISFDKPDFYEVNDQLIVFSVQGYFKVFSDGKIYTLENYIPNDYIFHNNILCYIDQLGNLKYFDGNKVETISYEQLSSMELHGNIVKYKFGVNSENLYFNGRTYKND
jgi:hypothetical protein